MAKMCELTSQNQLTAYLDTAGIVCAHIIYINIHIHVRMCICDDSTICSTVCGFEFLKTQGYRHSTEKPFFPNWREDLSLSSVWLRDLSLQFGTLSLSDSQI